MRADLETERLILRDLTPTDAGAAFAWCGDPAVNRYLNYPRYRSIADVREWLAGRDPDDPDKCYLGFVVKSSGELIGCGGISYHPERDAWSIGYALRADAWGNGYAVEAVSAVIDYVSASRPIKTLEGTVARENLRSRRVLEKLGLVPFGEDEIRKDDGSETFPALTYRKVFPENA